jgi:hypothetical protein
MAHEQATRTRRRRQRLRCPLCDGKCEVLELPGSGGRLSIRICGTPGCLPRILHNRPEDPDRQAPGPRA